MDTTPSLPEACTSVLERYLDATIFRALADPKRLSLLAQLAASAEPATVTELSSCCGVHISGVSRHLKMLHEAGLLQAERQGREVRYRLDCEALTSVLRGMADAIESCQAACCTQSNHRGPASGAVPDAG